MGSGTKAKLQATVLINIIVVQFMKAIGTMICSTEMVRKNGLMEPGMRANILKDKNMAKASLYGQVRADTKVNSKIMTLMELVFTFGMITANIKENGGRILFMVREFSLGKTVEFTKANIETIKNTGLAF